MPEGDRPEDKEGFDPLEQPPLMRRRQPPRGGSAAGAGDAADVATAEGGDADQAEGGEASTGEVAVASSAPPRPRGRLLGFLGLIFGLAGLGAAGYLYYLLVYLNPQPDLEHRIDELGSELAGRAEALQVLERAQARALEDLAERERRAREALTERVVESVGDVAAQAPPSTREWKIAEVAYLLRIANHRVLMERDANGALVLLLAADDILAELDDFALYQVRAELSKEIQALEQVETGDLQGLFLRLEAVKTELNRRSVKLPRFERDEPVDGQAPGFWSALVEQLGSYLRFRRFEGEGVRPLLSPEEAVYLELNLRLMLEQAQLAALRRESVVYVQSLQTAASWIASYLDTDDPAVGRMLGELEALSSVEVDAPLPDISGSLNALKAAGEA